MSSRKQPDAWKRLRDPALLSDEAVFRAAYRSLEADFNSVTSANVTLTDTIIANTHRHFIHLIGIGGFANKTHPQGYVAGRPSIPPGAQSPILIGSCALEAFAKGLGKPIGPSSHIRKVFREMMEGPFFGENGQYSAEELIALYFSIKLMTFYAYALAGLSYKPKADRLTGLLGEIVMQSLLNDKDARKAFRKAFAVYSELEHS